MTMKKVCLASAFSLALAGLPASALAKDGDVKVAVVDMEALVADSSQLKAEKKSLEDKFEKRHKDLVAMQKKLAEKMKAYQKDAAVMKAEAKQALEAEITKQQQAFQTQQGAYEKDVYNAQHKAMDKVMNAIRSAAKKVAKTKGVDLVLAKAMAVYADDDVDLTDDVKERLQ